MDEMHSHNDGDEDGGTDALEQHIGERLKHSIGYKEDSQCGIVFANREA